MSLSTLALAILALVLLIGPALVVLALDITDIWRTETYTISTHDLPNTAAHRNDEDVEATS